MEINRMEMYALRFREWRSYGHTWHHLLQVTQAREGLVTGQTRGFIRGGGVSLTEHMAQFQWQLLQVIQTRKLGYQCTAGSVGTHGAG